MEPPLVTVTTETDTIYVDLLLFSTKKGIFWKPGKREGPWSFREAKREGKTGVLQKAGKREGSVKLREGFREDWREANLNSAEFSFI